jgi:hypothetical protein
MSKISLDPKEKRERVIALATTTTQEVLYALTSHGQLLESHFNLTGEAE